MTERKYQRGHGSFKPTSIPDLETGLPIPINVTADAVAEEAKPGVKAGNLLIDENFLKSKVDDATRRAILRRQREIEELLTGKVIDELSYFEHFCRYIGDSELPVLVLATHSKEEFKKGRVWKPVVHQVGGYGCYQRHMIATRLKPKKKVLEEMRNISKFWLGSCIGMDDVKLDDVLKYRHQLQTLLGVDCSKSYGDFSEGIYPIDCKPEFLRKLCTDRIPENLDDFLNKKDPVHKIRIHRWNCYILGENCD